LDRSVDEAVKKDSNDQHQKAAYRMREQTIKQATKSLLGYVTCLQGIIESGHVQNYRQHKGGGQTPPQRGV